jgi:hypothetical protein
MEPPAVDRTAWMSGHYGLMVHWLYPGVLPECGAPARSLDEAVDGFGVERLLDDVAASGAGWLIFTLGQNTGFYASPNPVIEELAGPGHCSQRDLALELAQGLHAIGKRFIAYLPCEIAANTTLHAGLGWSTMEGTSQAEFQQRYARVVGAWAERLGSLLDGWWFDGCYTWPAFHNRHMDWPVWYAAARAGNSEAALAFNDGNFCVGNVLPVAPEHDYLSGEAEMLVDGCVRLGRSENWAPGHLPDGRFVPGTYSQWHCLLPVDCFWGHGNPGPEWLSSHPYGPVPASGTSYPMEAPIYGDAELHGFMHRCLAVGGAVTLNAGIYQEGYLGPDTVAQLRRFNI